MVTVTAHEKVVPSGVTAAMVAVPAETPVTSQEVPFPLDVTVATLGLLLDQLNC